MTYTNYQLNEQPSFAMKPSSFAQQQQQQQNNNNCAMVVYDDKENTRANSYSNHNNDRSNNNMIIPAPQHDMYRKPIDFNKAKYQNHHNTDGCYTTTTTTRDDIQQLSILKKMTTESIHPNRKLMKKQRKLRTAGGTVGGAVVGSIILGPVGTVLGASAGGVITNKLCKVGEKRAQRKHEQLIFQQTALQNSKVGCSTTASFA